MIFPILDETDRICAAATSYRTVLCMAPSTNGVQYLSEDIATVPELSSVVFASSFPESDFDHQLCFDLHTRNPLGASLPER